MSYLHYISASYELEEGTYYEDVEFEKSIIWINRSTLVVRDEYDIASSSEIMDSTSGMIIIESDENPSSIRIGQKLYPDKVFERIFSYKYIYFLTSEYLNLIWENDSTQSDVKYLGALYNYLDGILEVGESIELFTCWAGDEDKRIKEYVDINIDDEASFLKLKIKEGQFIRFYRVK